MKSHQNEPKEKSENEKMKSHLNELKEKSESEKKKSHLNESKEKVKVRISPEWTKKGKWGNLT